MLQRKLLNQDSEFYSNLATQVNSTGEWVQINNYLPSYSIERVWAWVKARVLKSWTAIQMRRTELTKVELLISLVVEALKTGIKEHNYANVLRMNNKFIEEMINLPWIKFKSNFERTYFWLPLLSSSCSASSLLPWCRWFWLRGWSFSRFLSWRSSSLFSLRSWHLHFLIWLKVVVHLFVLLFVFCSVNLYLRDHLRKYRDISMSIYSVDEVSFFTLISWALSKSMALLALLDSCGRLALVQKVRNLNILLKLRSL